MLLAREEIVIAHPERPWPPLAWRPTTTADTRGGTTATSQRRELRTTPVPQRDPETTRNGLILPDTVSPLAGFLTVEYELVIPRGIEPLLAADNGTPLKGLRKFTLDELTDDPAVALCRIRASLR